MPLYYAKAKLGFLDWETKAPVEFLFANEGKKLWVEIGRETGVRTGAQNNSLHLWLTQLAKELNEQGITVQQVLAKTVELDWNKDTLKENIWRPIQKALTGKKSSTELNKVSEIDEVYEHLNRFFSTNWGIHIPFPTK